MIGLGSDKKIKRWIPFILSLLLATAQSARWRRKSLVKRVNSGRQGPTSLPWTGEQLEHLEHLENVEHFEPHLLGQYPEDGEVHHEQSEDDAEGSGQGFDNSSGALSLLLANKVR